MNDYTMNHLGNVICTRCSKNENIITTHSVVFPQPPPLSPFTSEDLGELPTQDELETMFTSPPMIATLSRCQLHSSCSGPCTQNVVIAPAIVVSSVPVKRKAGRPKGAVNKSSIQDGRWHKPKEMKEKAKKRKAEELLPSLEKVVEEIIPKVVSPKVKVEIDIIELENKEVEQVMDRFNQCYVCQSQCMFPTLLPCQEHFGCYACIHADINNRMEYSQNAGIYALNVRCGICSKSSNIKKSTLDELSTISSWVFSAILPGMNEIIKKKKFNMIGKCPWCEKGDADISHVRACGYDKYSCERSGCSGLIDPTDYYKVQIHRKECKFFKCTSCCQVNLTSIEFNSDHDNRNYKSATVRQIDFIRTKLVDLLAYPVLHGSSLMPLLSSAISIIVERVSHAELLHNNMNIEVLLTNAEREAIWKKQSALLEPMFTGIENLNRALMTGIFDEGLTSPSITVVREEKSKWIDERS